jgi:uncharacterized protein (DUF924 family)
MSALVQPADLLTFWFGDADPAAAVAPNFARWFGGGPEFDAEVRARFGPTLDLALQGRLGGWLAHPQSLLAFVVLVDQFPRNAHRGSAQAFAWGPMGLAAALLAIESGADRAMGLYQRSFLYLPLEHTEDAAIQAQVVAAYTELVALAEGADRGVIASMLDHAQKHQAVIARFGRFPTRNAALGRESTPEELEFLASPARYP